MKVSNIEVRSRSQSSLDFLKVVEESKDPNRHYRWVRLDDTNSSVVKHKMKGYAPVLKDEVETMAEIESKGGDQIVVGDLLLMSCPKEEHLARMTEREQRTEALLKSTTLEAERRAAEKGIELIKDSDHKKETR